MDIGRPLLPPLPECCESFDDVRATDDESSCAVDDDEYRLPNHLNPNNAPGVRLIFRSKLVNILLLF